MRTPPPWSPAATGPQRGGGGRLPWFVGVCVADWVLPANAALAHVRALQQEVDAALARCGPEGLRIDASGLTAFDTATIALLLHAQRGARARGVPLRVHGLPPRLRELAHLYGVDGLLSLDPEPEAGSRAAAT